MKLDDDGPTSRRNVLRAAGVLGAASLGMAGPAAARSRPKSNDFGNGNGIGAFLNETAAYKPAPVWSEGVVDMTGRETVDVEVGAMTSVAVPNAPVDELPVAFAPQAVKVSPGTTVTWTWTYNPFGIPHDVVALEESGGNPLFDSGFPVFPPANPSDSAPTFSHTFDEAGTHLYYCTPHGAPFPVHPHGAPPDARIYNEFGMRGAVLVARTETQSAR